MSKIKKKWTEAIDRMVLLLSSILLVSDSKNPKHEKQQKKGLTRKHLVSAMTFACTDKHFTCQSMAKAY